MITRRVCCGYETTAHENNIPGTKSRGVIRETGYIQVELDGIPAPIFLFLPLYRSPARVASLRDG